MADPIRILLLSTMVIVAACSPRQAAERGVAHPAARLEPVFVATQRPLDMTGPAFGLQRTAKVNYFRADISVPPTHQTGHIEWPEGTPNAATDFVVTNTTVYNGITEFARDVHRRTPLGETVVYIPGYNNTLSESMYRLAQIRSDFEADTASVLFSWPSAGDPRGYIYDRDSILFARDDLERVLQSLTSRPGEKVFILAHSMGSHLTMEVLRQAALRGDRRLLSRISGVVLMSPDIDPDLFRRQADAVGELPQPFLIFTAQQDRVLSLASFLTGRKPRLGVIDGPDKVAGLKVQVIDFTELADGEGMNHSVPVTSPAAISVLNGLRIQSGQAESAFGDYMVLRAQP